MAALLYWFVLRAAPVPTPAAIGSAAASGSTSDPRAAKPTAVAKVRRITKDERTELAKQIETARAVREKKMNDAEGRDHFNKDRDLARQEAHSSETIVKTTMRDAMKEVIPMLADCYDKGGSNLPATLDVVAELTLTGDPDIGTIVDADSLKNKDGTPVNEAFGACVQDTLVTLEMPPISEGDVVKVTYPFAFARDDSTMPP
ncbi:MAG TPA: hypothetical protein VGM90_28595 [Kofleriaceae bacterium]